MADPSDLDALSSLAAFTPTRLLSNDREAKTACLLGTLGSTHQTIVRLAREPFADDTLLSGDATRGVALTPVVRNDVYLRATGTEGKAAAAGAASSLGVEVICPATEKHIAKYSDQKRVTLRESFRAYQGVTLPAVLALPPARTAWVENILEGKAEADRVLARWPPLNDEEAQPPAQAAAAAVAQAAGGNCAAFVLLPDLKWDGADPARLYAVSIFGDPSLRSLRDLDSAARVASVRTAHAACLAALAAATGTPASALRSFFHYHPSYGRLHEHFAAHGVPASDGVGKAHDAEEVLGEEGDGGAGSPWARRTLTVALREGDPLAGPLAVWMEAEAGGK